MKNTKEIIIPAITLCIICLIATFLLSITDSITFSRIQSIQKENSDKAMKKVCSGAVSFEALVTSKEPDTELYKALDSSGELIGYAVSTMDKSYGGDIKVMTGLDTSGNITGVEILQIDDTPGLGMNAKKENFRNQYIGKTAENINVSKNASGDEIQAITGATRTSEAVTRCVEKAYRIVSEKGGY